VHHRLRSHDVSTPAPCVPWALERQPTLVWATQVGTDVICAVDDFSRLAEEPPAWRGVAAATLGLGSGDRTDFVELPCGRTGRISSTASHGPSSEGYVYTDGETYIHLRCQSTDPPDDDWLSVAETFEWLDEAEQPSLAAP
jgi:hypothetical protein